MSKPLRSLSGLLDFDCAARWGSFKLAAQELHKTPAAVSLQIRQLEEALGFELFVRHPRQITLTEKGQELAATVRRTLSELHSKVASLQGGDEEKILRLSTTHSLAIKWLVPRIARFTQRYPEIDIRIDSSDRIANMEDGSTDIALRTYVESPGEHALLFRDRLVAVYSPSLLHPGASEITLADLEHYPLLHEFTTDTWIALLRQNHVLHGRYNFARSFTNFAVMVQSALAGQGVALVSYAIACEDLRNGALKMITCDNTPYQRGYYIIVAPDKKGMSKIRHFCDWLHAEVADMQTICPDN
ncbi:LysR substrate-binding domain-containing protein [Pseudoduganella danionis]|uniref:LysR family transcriptional regulator n=1 Tax=Pseudoduganella danionis TaxID=1890295 RepID=A0ABW9SIC2_9BURK|nr:LysR substrate-binding domain-containing protein [Pseudoduganella danionis]MTW31279.1 LysR family transcriptional regulator [Pseudoduganella danionis]